MTEKFSTEAVSEAIAIASDLDHQIEVAPGVYAYHASQYDSAEYGVTYVASAGRVLVDDADMQLTHCPDGRWLVFGPATPEGNFPAEPSWHASLEEVITWAAPRLLALDQARASA